MKKYLSILICLLVMPMVANADLKIESIEVATKSDGVTITQNQFADFDASFSKKDDYVTFYIKALNDSDNPIEIESIAIPSEVSALDYKIDEISQGTKVLDNTEVTFTLTITANSDVTDENISLDTPNIQIEYQELENKSNDNSQNNNNDNNGGNATANDTNNNSKDNPVTGSALIIAVPTLCGLTAVSFFILKKRKLFNLFSIITVVAVSVSIYSVNAVNSQSLSIHGIARFGDIKIAYIIPNGGTYAGKTTYTVIARKNGTVIELETPTYNNYKFNGWKTEDTTITENTITLDKDYILTADWDFEGYNVCFTTANNCTAKIESGSSYTINVTAPDTINVTAPAKAGYDFTGWTDGTTVYHNGDTITKENLNSSTSLLLTPNYTPKTLNVTLNAGDGVFAKELQIGEKDTDKQVIKQYTYSENGTYTDLPTPTYDGKTFVRWIYINSLGKEITVSGNTLLHTADVTLNPEYKDNELTITYKDTTITNTTCKYGETCTLSTETKPTSECKLNYWKDAEGNTYKAGATVDTTGLKNTTAINLELTAVCKNKYTVELYADADSGKFVTTTCEEGSDCKLDKNSFTRDYYHFIGWSTTPDSKEAEYTDEDTIKNIQENKKLYAVWEANKLTIKYDGLDVTTPCSVEMAYEDGDCVLTDKTPTNSDTTKYFAGWSGYGENLLNPKASISLDIIKTEKEKTINLKADWKDIYTITYDAAGGSITDDNGNKVSTLSFTCKEDKECSVKDLTVTKTGNKFTGWTYNGSTKQGGESLDKLTGDITLKAAWTPYTLTIIYNIDSSIAVLENTVCEYSSSTTATCQIADPKIDNENNYITGWENIITKEIYDVGKKISTAGLGTDTTIYVKPVYKNKYIITYNLNGGTGTIDSTVCYVGKDCIVTDKIPDNIAGHKFVGWSDGNGTTYGSGAEIEVSGDTKLYAQWEANKLTINYYATADGADDLYANPTCIYTDDTCIITSGSPDAPDGNEDVSFVGWSTTPNPTSISDVDYDSEKYTIDFKDMLKDDSYTLELYPVWVLKYTVTFDKVSDSAEGTMQEKTCYVGYKECSIPELTYTNANHNFKGWMYNNTLIETKDLNELITADNFDINITLYAKWELYNIKYIYEDEDENELNTHQCFLGTTCTFDYKIKDTDNIHYSGWINSANEKEIYEYDDSYEVTGLTDSSTVILKPKWQYKYAVTYDGDGGTTSGSNTSICYSGEDCILDTDISFKKNGYTFTNWTYDNKDAEDGNIGKIDGPVTVKAKWRPNQVNIKYDLSNADSGQTIKTTECVYDSSADSDKTYSVECKISKDYTPTKKNNRFLNQWQDSNGTIYDSDVPFTKDISDGDVDITVSPVWQEYYTIKLNPNGGAGTVIEQNCDVGKDCVIDTSKANFIRAGYKFLGWSTDPSATEATIYDENNINNFKDKLENADDKTLYAVWQANVVQIKFDANGGEGSTVTTCQVGSTTCDLSNSLKRDGYVIAGYEVYLNNSSELDSTIDKDLSSIDINELLIKPQWQGEESPTIILKVIWEAEVTNNYFILYRSINSTDDNPIDVHNKEQANTEAKIDKEVDIAEAYKYNDIYGYDLITKDDDGNDVKYYASYDSTLKSLVVILKYKPKEYSIVCKTSESDVTISGCENLQSYTVEDNKNYTITATKLGYTFTGWTIGDASFGETINSKYLKNKENDENEVTLIPEFTGDSVNIKINYKFEKIAKNADGSSAYETFTDPTQGTIGTSIATPLKYEVPSDLKSYVDDGTISGDINAYIMPDEIDDYTPVYSDEYPEYNVYYEYKLKTYKIVYDANAGTNTNISNIPETQTVIYGTNLSDYSDDTKPKRDNYDFLGWSINDSTCATDNLVTTVNEDFEFNNKDSSKVNTLYACWSLHKYKIELDNTSEQGTVKEAIYLAYNDYYYYNESNAFSAENYLTDPTNIEKGYYFVGWRPNSTSGLGEVIDTNSQFNNPTGIQTLSGYYSRIPYYIQFVNDTGEVIDESGNVISSDEKITCAYDAEKKDTNKCNLYDNIFSTDVTEQDGWQIATVTTANGELATVDYDSQKVYRSTIDDDNKSINALDKNDGSESTVDKDSIVILKPHMVNKKFTIKFELNNGEFKNEVEDLIVEYNKPYFETEADLEAYEPSRGDYYEFKGWYTNPEGTGDAVKVGTLLDSKDNITLYAVWQAKPKKIEVQVYTSNLGDSSNFTIDDSKNFDIKDINVDAEIDLSKYADKFDGFTLTKVIKGTTTYKYDSSASEPNYPKNAADNNDVLELYFTRKSYEFILQAKDGTILVDNKEVEYGTEYKLENIDGGTYGNAGKSIQSWYTDEDCTSLVETTSNSSGEKIYTMPAASTTLYGDWEDNDDVQVTIQFRYKNLADSDTVTTTQLSGPLYSTSKYTPEAKTGYITPEAQDITFESGKVYEFVYELEKHNFTVKIDDASRISKITITDKSTSTSYSYEASDYDNDNGIILKNVAYGTELEVAVTMNAGYEYYLETGQSLTNKIASEDLNLTIKTKKIESIDICTFDEDCFKYENPTTSTKYIDIYNAIVEKLDDRYLAITLYSEADEDKKIEYDETTTIYSDSSSTPSKIYYKSDYSKSYTVNFSYEDYIIKNSTSLTYLQTVSYMDNITMPSIDVLGYSTIVWYLKDADGNYLKDENGNIIEFASGSTTSVLTLSIFYDENFELSESNEITFYGIATPLEITVVMSPTDGVGLWSNSSCAVDEGYIRDAVNNKCSKTVKFNEVIGDDPVGNLPIPDDSVDSPQVFRYWYYTDTSGNNHEVGYDQKITSEFFATDASGQYDSDNSIIKKIDGKLQLQLKSEYTPYYLEVNYINIDKDTEYIAQSDAKDVKILIPDSTSTDYSFYDISCTDGISLGDYDISISTEQEVQVNYEDKVIKGTCSVKFVPKEDIKTINLLIDNGGDTSYNWSEDTCNGKNIFKSDGSQCFVNKYIYDTVGVLPDPPYRENYIFIGWTIDEEGKNFVSQSTPISEVIANNQYELHAQYKAIDTDGEIRLYDYISAQTKGGAVASGINFTKGSSSNISSGISSGVYTYDLSDASELEGNYKTYFYYGNSGMYIKYQEKYWYMLRTTDNGGTKLIYTNTKKGVRSDDVETTLSLETTSNLNEDILVYKKGNNIYDVLDTWYTNNIKEDGFIYDENYCNDLTASSDTYTNAVRYSAYDRFSAQNTYHYPESPKLVCNTSDERSVANGYLSHPVGLITLDEVFLAGNVLRSDDAYNFLGQYYLAYNYPLLTMTPYGATYVNKSGSTYIWKYYMYYFDNRNTSYTSSYLNTYTEDITNVTEKPVITLNNNTLGKLSGTFEVSTDYKVILNINYDSGNNSNGWEENTCPLAYDSENDICTISTIKDSSDVVSHYMLNYTPTRYGYNFDGWYTNPEGTGNPVRNGDVVDTSEGTTTLYAKWTPKKVETYIEYSGDDKESNSSYDILTNSYGGNYYLTDGTNTCKFDTYKNTNTKTSVLPAKYVVSKLYNSDFLGKRYADCENTTIDSEITKIIYIEPSYKVVTLTFNLSKFGGKFADGMTSTVSSVMYGSLLNEVNLPTPVKSGSTFKGWLDATTGKYYNIGDLSDFTKDTTLYGVFN